MEIMGSESKKWLLILQGNEKVLGDSPQKKSRPQSRMWEWKRVMCDRWMVLAIKMV
jgi:hypothetical protein